MLNTADSVRMKHVRKARITGIILSKLKSLSIKKYFAPIDSERTRKMTTPTKGVCNISNIAFLFSVSTLSHLHPNIIITNFPPFDLTNHGNITLLITP
jgi:hypothetical protein